MTYLILISDVWLTTTAQLADNQLNDELPFKLQIKFFYLHQTNKKNYLH